jgi:hypothetical protein
MSDFQFKKGMFCSCTKACGSFLCNLVCPCYNARSHRLALIGDIENYTCCAGVFGPGCTPKLDKCCCVKKCPGFCLCCEVVCCTGISVGGNRSLLQNRFMIKNSCCDNFLICLGAFAGCCICVMRCLGCDVGEEAKSCVDLLTCCVLSCMITQQEVEHRTRGVIRGAPPIPSTMSAGPPMPPMHHKDNRA